VWEGKHSSDPMRSGKDASLTGHRVAKSVERPGLSRQWEARTEAECAGYLRNGLLSY